MRRGEDKPRLPYPGLRSFRRDEADIFFGREDETDTMIARLIDARFLGVLGASGCGKSSLVRTALFEALEGGYSRAGSNWRIVDCHPGGAPMAHLASALGAASAKPPSADTAAYIEGELRRGPRAIARWCNEGNLLEGEKLLILVDQFEELFTTAAPQARDEVDDFATLLVEASRADDANVYIVVTMRSDYFGACGAHPALAEKIGEGIFLTPRMQRGQCAEAITGPADVLGFEIDAALVNRLLNDMNRFANWEGGSLIKAGQTGRQADQLPLMQYALNQMWLGAQKRASEGELELTLADYDELGGLEGALDRQGVELIDKLHLENGIGEDKVEAVFRALVRGPSLELAVRETKTIPQIAAQAGIAEEEVRRIVNVFADPGCLFLREDRGEVDLSHESLIRRWSLLSKWFEKEAEAVDTLGELARRTREWLGAEAADDALLTGRPLDRSEAFWAARSGNPAWIDAHLDPAGPGRDGIEMLLSQSAEVRGRQRLRQRMLMGVAMAAALVIPIGYGILQDRAAAQAEANFEEQKGLRKQAQMSVIEARVQSQRAKESALRARNIALELDRELTISKQLRTKEQQTAAKLQVTLARQTQLTEQANAARLAAEKATDGVRTALNAQIQRLLGDDTEKLTTSRRNIVEQYNAIAAVVKHLPDQAGSKTKADDLETAMLVESLRLQMEPFITGSIGPDFTPKQAAQALYRLADENPRGPFKSDMRQIDYFRIRAGELDGTLEDAAKSYQRLLEDLRTAPVGQDVDVLLKPDGLAEQIEYRLGLLAFAAGDLNTAETHLSACAVETIADLSAQCAQLLAEVAARDPADKIVLPQDRLERLKDRSKNLADAEKSAGQMITGIYTIASLYRSNERSSASLGDIEQLRRSALVYNAASGGTEESVNLSALAEEVGVLSNEDPFALRRQVLGRIGENYHPTLDFLIASEPSMLSKLPNEPDTPESLPQEPSVLLGGNHRKIVPTRQQLNDSVDDLERSVALLRGYDELIAATAKLPLFDGAVQKGRLAAAERAKSMLALSAALLARRVRTYHDYLAELWGLADGQAPTEQREIDQIYSLQTALDPVIITCIGLEKKIASCQVAEEAVDAVSERAAAVLGSALDSVEPAVGLDESLPQIPPRPPAPELDGMAIDWLAVGQVWPGRPAYRCTLRGKTYLRAFPVDNDKGDCAIGNFDEDSASNLITGDLAFLMREFTVEFTMPVTSSPLVTSSRTIVQIEVSPGDAVNAPAPGRIGQLIAASQANLVRGVLLRPPCGTKEVFAPIERAGDKASSAPQEQASGESRAESEVPRVASKRVLCHADGSYSVFNNQVQFDSSMGPGTWVRQGQRIGSMAKQDSKEEPVPLSWVVRTDGLYNWDNSARDIFKLPGIAPKPKKDRE